MINSSKYLVAILGIFLITLNACNKDFLDTVPQTTVTQKEAFSSPGKILAQVNNLYRQLQSPTFYGGRYIIFNEQRADEFGQNDGNAATGSAVWNQNVASTNDFVNNVWSAAYSAINASNILIANLKETAVIPDSVSKLYIAEAKFVRGLCYLSLIQTYAKPYAMDKNALGVPLRLSAITTSGHNDLKRSTVEEVYQQIINDLDEAEADLPVSYATANLNSSRAHKSTAIALKTRVYLIQGNFEKVIEEAAKIVPDAAPYQYARSGIIHQLEPNISTVFSGSYTGPEAIFSIPFINSTTETPPTQSALAFNYVSQPILILAQNGIVKDSALQAPEDARTSFIGSSSAKQKILKKFNLTTSPFRDYVPVIRYAEVLLNYAEAAAHTNNQQKAIELFKAVRNRSNPGYVFTAPAVFPKEALVNTILTERRIEFLGEGFRLGDLQRTLQDLPPKTGPVGVAPAVKAGASNYIWPIPSGEISANKLIEPNP